MKRETIHKLCWMALFVVFCIVTLWLVVTCRGQELLTKKGSVCEDTLCVVVEDMIKEGSTAKDMVYLNPDGTWMEVNLYLAGTDPTPPDPIPDPTPPDPTPDDGLVQDKTFVLITYETGIDNLQTAIRGIELLNFLEGKFKGKYRLYDNDLRPDMTSVMPQPFDSMYKKAVEDNSSDEPWLVLFDGTTVISEKLTGSPSNAVNQIQGHLK